MFKSRIGLCIGGAVLLAAVAIGGLLIARAGTARGAGDTPADTLAHQLNDPTYQTCRAQGKVICNPSAWATEVAGTPWDQPPTPGAALMSRAAAITLARRAAESQITSAAPATSTIYARLLTLPQYEAMEREGHDTATNPNRPLWAVTVHAPTAGEIRGRPIRYSVYSLLIDAASGQIFHVCIGCAVLSSN